MCAQILGDEFDSFPSSEFKQTYTICSLRLFMETTTVGSLWLENDLHENELEFESHMGRSKKNVRVT